MDNAGVSRRGGNQSNRANRASGGSFLLQTSLRGRKDGVRCHHGPKLRAPLCAPVPSPPMRPDKRGGEIKLKCGAASGRQGSGFPRDRSCLRAPRWLRGSLRTPWPGCHEPGEPESRGTHCSHSGGASATGPLRSTEGTTRCAPCWPGESGGHIAGGPQQPSGLVLFRARDSGRTGGFSGAQDGRDSAALPETVRKKTACAGPLGPGGGTAWPSQAASCLLSTAQGGLWMPPTGLCRGSPAVGLLDPFPRLGRACPRTGREEAFSKLGTPLDQWLWYIREGTREENQVPGREPAPLPPLWGAPGCSGVPAAPAQQPHPSRMDSAAQGPARPRGKLSFQILSCCDLAAHLSMPQNQIFSAVPLLQMTC